LHDRRLERQLRRINGEGPALRALCAAIALVCGAMAVLLRDTPLTSFMLALTAVIPAAAWLRRYHRARPGPGVILHNLAAGAFLGALFTAVWMHEPGSLHEWLRLPGERAAPAAVVVLLVAMTEDVARELIQALRPGG
jgi:hypothetical protein